MSVCTARLKHEMSKKRLKDKGIYEGVYNYKTAPFLTQDTPRDKTILHFMSDVANSIKLEKSFLDKNGMIDVAKLNAAAVNLPPKMSEKEFLAQAPKGWVKVKTPIMRLR